MHLNIVQNMSHVNFCFDGTKDDNMCNNNGVDDCNNKREKQNKNIFNDDADSNGGYHLRLTKITYSWVMCLGFSF